MDPLLLPFVEDALRRAPVARFEVRHREKTGDSVVGIVDVEGKSPADLAEEIWGRVEEDASCHLTETAYWVVFFRFGSDGLPLKDAAGRKGFWTNRDKLSQDNNPMTRALGVSERSLTQREGHIIDLQRNFLDMHLATIKVQSNMIQRLLERLNEKESREQTVIEQWAALKELEASREVDKLKELRTNRIYEKLESFGLQLLGQATTDKDGTMPAAVQGELIQQFVDTLDDNQLGSIMGSLRDDQRGALVTVLQPFIARSLEKRRADAALAAKNVSTPSEVEESAS